MSYNKYTWKSGDVISSARLNNIEDGIEEAMSSGGGVMVVNVTKSGENYTADKTCDEIKAAIDGDQTVIVKYQHERIGALPVTGTNYFTLNFMGNKYFVFEGCIDAIRYRIQISSNGIGVFTCPTTIETRISNTADVNSYSKVDVTYTEIVLYSNFDIKLLVIGADSTMVYTMNEFYPNDQVIAFSGAGKVGPLYMDKDGNISETYPTSSGGGYS